MQHCKHNLKSVKLFYFHSKNSKDFMRIRRIHEEKHKTLQDCVSVFANKLQSDRPKSIQRSSQ